jgi:hypothetical protein
MPKRKFSGGQKAVLWFGVLLCVWELFRNQRILESFFVFLTVGVIPGTEVKLSADAVLNLLPVVFGLIVLLIFRKEAMRGLRALWRWGRPRRPAASPRGRQRVRRPADEQAADARDIAAFGALGRPIVAAAAAAAPYEAVTVQSVMMAPEERKLHRMSGSVHPALRSPFKKRFHTFMHRADMRLGRWLNTTGYYGGFAWEWLSVHSGRLWRKVRRVTATTWRIIKIEAAVLWRLSCRLATRLWRWLAPYLWRFDAWLGVQFHQLVREIRRYARRYLKR